MSTPLEAASPIAVPEDRGAPPAPFAELWRDFRRNRGAMIGLAVIVALVLCALLADVIAPYSPREQFSDAVLKPPSMTPIGVARLADAVPAASAT